MAEINIRHKSREEAERSVSGSRPTKKKKEPVQSITFALTKSFQHKVKVAAALEDMTQSALLLRALEPEVKRIYAKHGMPYES